MIVIMIYLENSVFDKKKTNFYGEMYLFYFVTFTRGEETSEVLIIQNQDEIFLSIPDAALLSGTLSWKRPWRK